MAHSVACKDAGMDCPAEFKTETKEELMEHIELHAQREHPGVELDPAQVDALIKSS